MTVILIDEGLFSQLSMVPRFNEWNGHTYRDYLLRNLLRNEDIPEDLQQTLQTFTEPSEILDCLVDHGIEYTHEHGFVPSPEPTSDT